VGSSGACIEERELRAAAEAHRGKGPISVTAKPGRWRNSQAAGRVRYPGSRRVFAPGPGLAHGRRTEQRRFDFLNIPPPRGGLQCPQRHRSSMSTLRTSTKPA
jgi:hypothetical protein